MVSSEADGESSLFWTSVSLGGCGWGFCSSVFLENSWQSVHDELSALGFSFFLPVLFGNQRVLQLALNTAKTSVPAKGIQLKGKSAGQLI